MSLTTIGTGRIGTAFAADVTVTDEAGLISALSTATNNDTITIDGTITLNSELYIDKEVTIKGDGGDDIVLGNQFLIRSSNVKIENLTFKDSHNYGINIYRATGVTLKNITVVNATKGGILVNGSNVTLNDTITLTNNTWGGIDVSKGNGVTETPTLDINGAMINFS